MMLLRGVARAATVLAPVGILLAVVQTGFALSPTRFAVAGGQCALFALIFIAVASMAMIQLLGFADVSRREAARLMYAGCPPWMRRATYILAGIGIAMFFLPAARGDWELGEPAASVWLSGFGIFTFAGTFSQAYSFLHLPRLASRFRCLNGHSASPTANFCETCGSAVVAT